MHAGSRRDLTHLPRSGLPPTGGAVRDGLAGGEDAEGMPALGA
jgi:hypothetical protein